MLKTDRIINLHDAKNLILWVLADGKYLPWAFVRVCPPNSAASYKICYLQGKPLIKKCVIIHMPGIDVELWETHKVT